MHKISSIVRSPKQLSRNSQFRSTTGKTNSKRVSDDDLINDSNGKKVEIQKTIDTEAIDLTSQLSGEQFTRPNNIRSGVPTLVEIDCIVHGITFLGQKSRFAQTTLR